MVLTKVLAMRMEDSNLEEPGFGRIRLAEGDRHKEHTPIMEIVEHCMGSFTSSVTAY